MITCLHLKNVGIVSGRSEFALLVLVTVIYLALNALFTASWLALTNSDEFLPDHIYHIFIPLLLSAMLFSVYYSIIRFANIRAEESELQLAAVISEQEHRRIRENLETHRERLHDTRQLLRSLSAIAQSGSREELLNYIDEAMEHIRITDERFCSDSHMNGILQYYAALAAASGIPFSAQVCCADLSTLPETDLTMLLGNVFENAIHATKEYLADFPRSEEGIALTADDSGSLFRIQISNPCRKVSYSQPETATENESFLPAEAFLSTSGSGHGLGRISAIAGKYDGTAIFRYDEKKHRFITRIALIKPDKQD